jgi:hypothetical protein
MPDRNRRGTAAEFVVETQRGVMAVEERVADYIEVTHGAILSRVEAHS